MDVESMTVQELKRELKSRDLKVGGLKAELKTRLMEALNESPTTPSGSGTATDSIADFEEYINVRYPFYLIPLSLHVIPSIACEHAPHCLFPNEWSTSYLTNRTMAIIPQFHPQFQMTTLYPRTQIAN